MDKPMHLFLINPGAGGKHRRKAAETAAEIAARMEARAASFEIAFTTHPMHAAELTRAYADTYAPLRVYACGGDGTLNEAVCGAAGFAHVAVTHFPRGVGNDFVKSFGPHAARFYELDELLDGETVPLDLIEVNGERYGLNIASVGFDARVSAEMRRFRRLSGHSSRRAYDLSVVYNLFHGIHRPYKADIDGKRLEGRFTLLLAGNGQYYGGGYHPVPEARPDDGALDFLLAGPVSVFRLGTLIGKFAAGRHRELPELFTYVRGKRMDIECDRESPVNVDGETLAARRVSFALSDKTVNFIVPRGAMGVFAKEKETEDSG